MVHKRRKRLSRADILIQARKKRDTARRLLKKGLGGGQIEAKLIAQFGSGLGEGVLTKLRHELGLGWTNPATRGQRLSVYPESYQVAILPKPTKKHPHKLDPDLRKELGKVFGWMLAEGIVRIELDPATLKIKLGYADEKDKAS